MCFLVTVSSLPTSPTTSAPAAGGGDGNGSTDVGAIAGGTVGGIAGAVVVLAAAFFCVRQRRKDPRLDEVPELQDGERNDKEYLSDNSVRRQAYDADSSAFESSGVK